MQAVDAGCFAPQVNVACLKLSHDQALKTGAEYSISRRIPG
jgi:hypothetical protein